MKMNKIIHDNKELDQHMTIKYLEYLSEYAMHLTDRANWEDDPLFTYVKEYELFLQRIEASSLVEQKLKIDIRSIYHDIVEDQNNSYWVAFQRTYSPNFAIEEIIDAMRDFNDRIHQILISIDKYKFKRV